MRILPVYFVVLPGVHLLDLSGPAQAFSSCEDRAVKFELHYVAPQTMISSAQGLSLGQLDPLPESIEADALIIVPGVKYSPNLVTDPTQLKVAAWLASLAPEQRLFCFICAGALLAGMAGILKGKNCTTHHGLIQALQKLEPQAKVLSNRIFVQDGSIYTCAGITAGIDLSLFLITQICGHPTALEVAREMVVFFRRSGEDPQLSFWLQHRNHIHPGIHFIQDKIAQEPAANHTLPILAQLAGMSTRSLTRSFRENTGLSIAEYQQQLRINLAQKLLESSSLSIDEVAEHAGFGTARSLLRIWKKWAPGTPSSFRKN